MMGVECISGDTYILLVVEHESKADQKCRLYIEAQSPENILSILG
jgi:hypothetical protein